MVVTKAQVIRAQAALETARIRLGYTEVNAGWRGGREQRVVAERYVDEGETVTANAPLLRIVELNPIKGVFFVTERDYATLQPGQRASLITDAYPDATFQRRDRAHLPGLPGEHPAGPGGAADRQPATAA